MIRWCEMIKWMAAAITAGAVGAGGAAAPPPDEIITTPPELEFKGVTAQIEEVTSPNVVVVAGLGPCALIGVRVVAPDDPYYDKAKKFVKERVAGKKVRVEICPNIPVNDQGQKRALVFYREGERWLNLSISLVEAGLARVADVPGCHVATKAWLQYEKEAREAGRGIWSELKTHAPMTSDVPDESDFK